MSIKSQLFQFLIKLYVKFVTKVTRGARTCIFNASPMLPLSSMEAMQRANKVVCYVPRRQPCTTIRRVCLETSPEQRSTAAKSRVRRNGSARNVLRNMGCSNSKICGIQRTNVIVEHSSPIATFQYIFVLLKNLVLLTTCGCFHGLKRILISYTLNHILQGIIGTSFNLLVKSNNISMGSL